MVYGLVFSIQLKTAADDTAFLTAFQSLRQHVNHAEPGALTYDIFPRIDEDGTVAPFAYIVLERYATQTDLDVHGRSPVFEKFLATVKALGVVTMHLQHCADNTSLLDKLNSLGDTSLPSGSPTAAAAAARDAAMQAGVLVFGGARPGKHESYVREASSLGDYIAKTLKVPLVYGGGTVGLMGAVAQTVQQHKGRVISIIPKPLCPREASGEMIGDMIYYTASMSERKSIMFAFADTVVALPGGVGTFDELLEVITLFQLNAYRPKIGIINANKFFEPFFGVLRHMISEGFLEERVFSFIVVAETAVELMEALAAFVPPESPAKMLVWPSRP